MKYVVHGYFAYAFPQNAERLPNPYRHGLPAISVLAELFTKKYKFPFFSNTICERRWELERNIIACCANAVFLHGRILFLSE